MSNWLSEITKLAKEDKLVKWTIRIVAIAFGLLILFCFYLLGRTLYHGRTAKIASKEYSFPDSEGTKGGDVSISDTSNKDILKKDSMTIKKSRAYSYKPRLKQTSIERVDTPKNNAKFNLQNPVFNAPTQVGDNNTQNNTVPELPDRALNELDKSIIKSLVKPGYTIDFECITSNSEETQIYANQMLDYLQRNYIVKTSSFTQISAENKQRGRKRFYTKVDDAQKSVLIFVQTQQ